MRALLSVYDKDGLIDFATALQRLGWDVISTGGTLRTLRAAGLPVTPVDDVTGFPEIMDGRVKTLHPSIHGGILARRDRPDDLATIAGLGIDPIDLVAVNLYPFAETVARPDCTLDEAIENIDIGGPAMIRAAAKNYAGVIVLTSPGQYAGVLTEIASGYVRHETRRRLAAEAFRHVSRYDALVTGYLASDMSTADDFLLHGTERRHLRYGENPHQAAAAYRTAGNVRGILDAAQLGGKELSYNNLLDADAALGLCRRFTQPACVIVKHTIPCGAAVREHALDAFTAALATDPVSAFGGIVALNRPVDQPLAEEIRQTFFEVIVAPGFSTEAREVLASRKSLRLLDLAPAAWTVQPYQSVRTIAGGMLVQDADIDEDTAETWTTVTLAAIGTDQQTDLAFAWEVVRAVRSNAIVLVKNGAVVGVGPGQPNRVDSVRIALERAGERAAGSVLASDAYFPFADGVESAIAGGVAAIVQPGGSIRDSDVIAACDGAGIPMMFTGRRHFLH